MMRWTTWLLTIGTWACMPATSPIAISCGVGTQYDATSASCVADVARCASGTRLDDATALCVPKLVCGAGTELTPDGRGCEPTRLPVQCGPGTQPARDTNECISDPNAAAHCGDSTVISDDGLCAHPNTQIHLEEVMRFEIEGSRVGINDVVLAGTTVHIVAREHPHIIRANIVSGQTLPPIVGREFVRRLAADPESGALYLGYEDHIDVVQPGETEPTPFAQLNGVSRMFVAGARLAVTDDARMLHVYDRQDGALLASLRPGPGPNSDGVYVPEHDAVFLAQRSPNRARLVRLDMSQMPPAITEWPYDREYLARPPLRYDAARDLLIGDGGVFVDPGTLEAHSALGMRIDDAVWHGEHTYILREQNSNLPARHLTVLDSTFRRTHEAQLHGFGVRLLIAEDQVYVLDTQHDTVRLLRVTLAEDNQ